MSGLTNFLTPYSHLIFANRDKVIVVLALVLGWTVIQLLVARWRTERLQRDLTAARSSQSTSPARARHMPAQLAEEAPAEPGGLPPIKGGRSYARNLGSALQKAGIPAASPQIYSPPVPAGWSPNTGANPPAPMPAPMQPPTYAPQAAPWGQAPAQPQAPWPYAAGGNRPAFGAPPGGPMPSPYPPLPAGGTGPVPSQPYAQQPFPSQYPQAGQAPFAQPFTPSSAPAESGRPNLDAAPTASSAPGAFAPPQLSPASTPPAVGGFVAQSAPEVQVEGDAKEADRRGKPKRRRFNLSVLDNLEKMVQSKPSEPTADPVAPAAASVPAPPAVTAPSNPVPVVSPAFAAPTLFEPAPAAEPVSAVAEPAHDEAPAEAYSEPLDVEPEPPQAEIEAPDAAEQTSRTRPDMHAMLFGEEPAAAEAVTPEPVLAEEQASQEEAPAYAPVEATASWPEPLAPVQEEPVAEAEAVAEEAVAEFVEPAPEAQLEPEAVQVESQKSAEAVEAPADGGEEAAAASANAGVLVIIEDDQTAADYYATLFRGNGYNVNVANDGISGVDLCVRVQPQVILLDVMMPRQNGILVLQTLRASDETRNTPVVVMSNFSEPTLIKRALQLGALEYVIKTQVEGAALLDALPRWINREKAFAA